MKKLILCVALIAAISVPAAFSQLRFELGANVPVAATALSMDGDFGEMVDLVGDNSFIPIANSSLLLQANLGLFKLGVGVKVHSLMFVVYAGYPNVQAEIALGPLSVDASLGGYYFGIYAMDVSPTLIKADLLIPEVSAWLALGKKKAFRIGGGAIGLLPTSFDLSEVPMILYGGMKIVLE